MTREKTVILSLGLLLGIAVVAIVGLFGLFWGLSDIGSPGPNGTAGGPAGVPAGADSAAAPGAPNTAAADPAAASPDLVRHLNLTTEPTGANVLLDGRLVGLTPLQNFLVPAGPHSLRLEKEGCEPRVLALILHESETTLHESLAPLGYAQLVVQSQPAGAQVVIDGELRGRTPLTLSRVLPGPHELRVAKPNYSTWQSVVVLQPGQTLTLKDLKLDNQLLTMLEALLEQDRRSIGNWMELAHYHYINNDMLRAAACFMRGRELAALPTPPANPDITEGEREALLNEAQWDRGKLIGEIRKHLEQGPTYYGSELNYELFKTEYNTLERDFNNWQGRWNDLKWVENEAFARGLKGDWLRVETLFEDYVTAADAKSAAGWAGLVKADLMLGRLGPAGEHFAQAQTLLNAPLPTTGPAVKVETEYREIAWLDLAKAYTVAAWRAPAAGRKPLLDQVALCLTGLEAVKTRTLLTRLEAARCRGQWLRLSNDKEKRVKFLTESVAQAQSLLDALAPTASDRRFGREELERLRLQLAWAEIALGQVDAGRKRAEALNGPETYAADVAAEAKALCAAFARGEKPVEPGLDPAVPVSLAAAAKTPDDGAPAPEPTPEAPR